MKKTLALIFSMALVCCAFTACGNDKNNSSEAEKTTEAITGNRNHTNDTNSSNNVIEEIVTDAGNVVDDLVSGGEKIVDDAGSAINGSNNTATDNNRWYAPPGFAGDFFTKKENSL